MARYDKYDPRDGGFRAPLAFAVAAVDAFTPYAVGLDANGHVVKGAGNTGVRAVMIAHGPKNVGDIVDNMTDGEIVEFGGVAGSGYVGATADGAITQAAADGTHTNLGFTAEAARLIVRVAR